VSQETRCSECGGPLPAGSPEGQCPKCLLKRGLEANTLEATAGPLPASACWLPPKPEDLAPRFPELDILELIGRGGMGAVYKARQKNLQRVVALKILPPEIGRAPAFADRFAREAQAMARLSHSHIVSIYDFGDRQGLYFFLMEYVDGLNLRQLLDSGTIAPKEALAIVPQICEALQFAHDQGIVHRDIKPENILLDKRGQVKIADFGLAKLMGQGGRSMPGEPGSTEWPGATGGLPASAAAAGAATSEKVMGTPDYMAPEQVDHPKDVDHRADIYSLGVVFYQMLTGELPRGRFEPPSHKVLIDVRLDEVVLKALAREPERRFQQASQVKTEVETIVTTPRSAPLKPPALPGDRPANPTSAGQPAEAGLLAAPRFSRKAIIGAAWAPLSFAVVLMLLLVRMQVVQSAMLRVQAEQSSGPLPPGPVWWQIMLIVALAVLGLSAPFGTTILGAVALSQIRHSAGRLTGLTLALADVLLFPLVVLDGLISWALVENHFGVPEIAIVVLVIDAVIVWLAWRAARKPVGGGPLPSGGAIDVAAGPSGGGPAAGAPAAKAAGTRATVVWSLAYHTFLMLLLVVVGGKIIYPTWVVPLLDPTMMLPPLTLAVIDVGLFFNQYWFLLIPLWTLVLVLDAGVCLLAHRLGGRRLCFWWSVVVTLVWALVVLFFVAVILVGVRHLALEAGASPRPSTPPAVSGAPTSDGAFDGVDVVTRRAGVKPAAAKPGILGKWRVTGPEPMSGKWQLEFLEKGKVLRYEVNADGSHTQDSTLDYTVKGDRLEIATDQAEGGKVPIFTLWKLTADSLAFGNLEGQTIVCDRVVDPAQAAKAAGPAGG
jgi:predicted Ser/Thr protein kinase